MVSDHTNTASAAAPNIVVTATARTCTRAVMPNERVCTVTMRSPRRRLSVWVATVIAGTATS